VDLVQEKKFEKLFKEYFPALTQFARKYVYDFEMAKDIVHSVFIKMWEKWEALDTDNDLSAYMYRSVQNKCLNHLRDTGKKPTEQLPEHDHQLAVYIEARDYLEERELENKIREGFDLLPEKCRQVFEMNRFEDLKYKEIAQKLNISVKTVENQIGKALKILREHLSDHLIIIYVLIKIALSV
jgi:RNA polymerase sigma-70 factor (ECF subfamily)